MSDRRRVAIVGGGFFGVLAALRLSQAGFHVTIFEKQTGLMLGASYINQNRLHMGYHYPRSDETARDSCLHQVEFQTLFPESVVDDFEHYYCVAREGSYVSGKEFTDFCDRLRLPYEDTWPKSITLNRDTVETCLRVPEKLYDANILRQSLRRMLEQERNVDVMLNTELLGINRFHDGFEIHYHGLAGIERMNVDAVINATYSNINRLITMLGCAPRTYQFELCEVAVVKVPWAARVGCGVMDGPFFGILPFGKSGSYLLYDVEISVLERAFGHTPSFNREVSYYDHEIIRAERFRRYQQKAAQYIKEMADCLHLYSTYVPRVVLAHRDADDARPTEILKHADGVWSIFAGKISLALPTATQLTLEIQKHLDERDKKPTAAPAATT
jgi:hypothetical protein